MDSSLLERCVGTTVFRVLLTLAACAVLPVLSLGIWVTAAIALDASWRMEAGEIAFSLLALGGALGMIGWVRALLGTRAPARHNVAATLLLLVGGIVTALTVAASVTAMAVPVVLRGWSDAARALGLGGLFVAANLIWVLAGVASIQRLLRRYAESTGRTFDSLPVVLLGVAIVLATAASLATLTV